MNRKELKKLIKPIVKECINEVLLQEGVLSSIISEVMVGTQNAVLQEQPMRKPKAPPSRLETDDEAMRRIQERKSRSQRSQDQKRKLLDAIGKDAYGGVDLFEGTQALNSGGNPDAGAQPQGALSGYAPDDAGVNIDGLLNIAGGAWKKIK